MKRTRSLVFIFAGALVLAMALTGQANATCSDVSLKGSFGFTATGTRIDGGNPGPRAFVGTFTADGQGNLSGSETVSVPGGVGSGVTFSGTYSVNPDCTGSATLTLVNGEDVSQHDNFVILRSGAEIQFIRADVNRIITGVAKPLAE